MSVVGNRKFLKGYEEAVIKAFQSDQSRGVPVPEMVKPFPESSRRIGLPEPGEVNLGDVSLTAIIDQRQSRRKFTEDPVTLEELSFLLHATQGIKRQIRNKENMLAATIRTAPSAGARHPFETYLIVSRVTGVAPGLYRYLPLEHSLGFLHSDPDLPNAVVEACCGQKFVGTGAVIFIWTALPYRMEWRYHQYAAKFVAQDSGHLCQNLYLAAEAIGGGTCGIGAYYQDKIDAVIGVDGADEFSIYIAPVGKIRSRRTVRIDLELLQRYTGVFQSGETGKKFTVQVAGDRLMLDISGRTRFTLNAFTETEFRIDDTDAEIRFEFDDNGRVRSVSVDEFGEISHLERVEEQA
ncbi:SagB family peptide dehydrogenase [bacterium]|nr:SagB family peptide dehydrogenase [candidate division CSSED10-310 bacterium]